MSVGSTTQAHQTALNRGKWARKANPMPAIFYKEIDMAQHSIATAIIQSLITVHRLLQIELTLSSLVYRDS
jgi:hypothetical protein